MSTKTFAEQICRFCAHEPGGRERRASSAARAPGAALRYRPCPPRWPDRCSPGSPVARIAVARSNISTPSRSLRFSRRSAASSRRSALVSPPSRSAAASGPARVRAAVSTRPALGATSPAGPSPRRHRAPVSACNSRRTDAAGACSPRRNHTHATAAGQGAPSGDCAGPPAPGPARPARQRLTPRAAAN
jgi:hypothetical protein